MRQQILFTGDLVRVAKEMPLPMRHFACDQDAIVIHSYADIYGGEHEGSYCIYLLKKGSQSSWYKEDQLTFIDSDRYDLLPDDHQLKRNWIVKTKRDLP